MLRGWLSTDSEGLVPALRSSFVALNGAKRSTENTESLLPEPDASRSHVRHSQAPRAFNGPYACDIVDAALALDFGAGVRGCEQYCNELFSIGYSLRQVSRYDILLNFFFFSRSCRTHNVTLNYVQAPSTLRWDGLLNMRN